MQKRHWESPKQFNLRHDTHTSHDYPMHMAVSIHVVPLCRYLFLIIVIFASVYLNVIHLLFAFDIIPAKDADGKEIIPPIEFKDAHVS